jgi:hypothetical protein
MIQRSDLVNLVETKRNFEFTCDRDYCLANVFEGVADRIASYWTDDYQGVCAWAYEFADGSVLLISDYFGSCTGCDSFQAAYDYGDGSTFELVRDLVYNGHLEPSREAAVQWILEHAETDKYSSAEAFFELIPELESGR